MEEAGVGGGGDVLVVHEGEDEVVFAEQEGEFAGAALVCYAEVEADLEEAGKLGDVGYGEVDVIEFCHGCDLLVVEEVAWEGLLEKASADPCDGLTVHTHCRHRRGSYPYPGRQRLRR